MVQEYLMTLLNKTTTSLLYQIKNGLIIQNVSVHSITTLNQIIGKVKDTLFVNLNDVDPI